jgi:hypothetical protein
MSDVDDQPTCGKGLAENSRVPAEIARLLEALADNLDAHLPTLDLDDPHAIVERDAYVALAKDFHTTAQQLADVATRMAGYRDLPMPRHQVAAFNSPRIVEAFEAFVTIERQLASLLQSKVDRDEALLSSMREMMRAREGH